MGVAIGGMEANKKVFWWNGNRSPWKCVSIIADPDAALRAVQTEIDLVPTGEYSPYLESVKEIIQVYIYSKYFNPDNNTIDFNNPQITCNPSVQINRIITEYEFYRHFLVGGAPDLAMNTLDYQNYEEILGMAACLRTNSPCPYLLDTYLGWLDIDNLNDLQQAMYIDYVCDRVCLHTYRCDPIELAGNLNGRALLFGNPATKPNTDLWPIFSNESTIFPPSPDHPDLNQADFLGGYLTDPTVTYNPSGGHTMACAESQFYADYPSTSSASLDNQVHGVLWFTYTNKRDHSILRKRNQQGTSDLNININNDEMNIISSNSTSVEIFNILGHSISSVENTNNNIRISLKQFNPGVYLAVINDNGTLITKKFVIL